MGYIKDYATTGTQVQSVDSTASVFKNMFGWMACGLGLSALSALVVIDRLTHSEVFAEIFLSQATMWGMIIATFGLVLVLNGMIHRLSFMTATLLFALYSALMGAWIAPVLLIYTEASVVKVFLITAGTFAATAFYGFVTRKDLSKVGQIGIMALIGVIIASVVNIFLHSSMMEYIISYITVAIFTGLTMYDVQRFKNLIYSYGDQADDNIRKIALLGALELYLDFLNLFLALLRILGGRK